MASNVSFFWEEPVDIMWIKSAWQKAFKRQISDKYWMDLWEWRFKNNPLSSRTDAAYIIDSNEIASFVAFSPLQIVLGGNIYKAALGNIGFTNPDYQGRGYYSKMYNSLIDQMTSEGFQVLIGFDNHNSHYPEVKYLQWKDIGTLNNFSLSLTDLSGVCETSKVTEVRTVPVSQTILSELSGFLQNIGNIHIERSCMYLKWRLLDNPRYVYRVMIVGSPPETMYIIYKEFADKEIDIMEIACSQAVMDLYGNLNCGLREFFLQGFQKVNLWSNLFTKEHLELEKIGFKETDFSAYFVCRELIPLPEIIEYKDWHIRFLDSDVF